MVSESASLFIFLSLLSLFSFSTKRIEKLQLSSLGEKGMYFEISKFCRIGKLLAAQLRGKNRTPTRSAHAHSENTTLPRAYQCNYKRVVQVPAEFRYLTWLADFGSFFCIPSNKNCLLHFFPCMATLIQLKYFPVFIFCHTYLSNLKVIVRVLYLQFFLP